MRINRRKKNNITIGDIENLEIFERLKELSENGNSYGNIDFIKDLDDLGVLTLDSTYNDNHSYAKTVTNEVMRKVDITQDGYTMSITNQTLFATIASMKYKEKWNRLYAILTTEYNPIDNYNMVEEGVDDTTTTSSENGTVTKTDTSEYGKTILNDRTTATTIDESGRNSQLGTTETIAHNGEIINESLHNDVKNTGTVSTSTTTNATIKNDSTKTEEINETDSTTNHNTNSRTDDLTSTSTSNEDVTFNRNLETSIENLSNGSVDTRVKETETDNLIEATTGTNDKNNTKNLTSTRTDNLKEVTTKNGNDTQTLNNTDKTEYNTTKNTTNDIDISEHNQSTVTNNTTEEKTLNTTENTTVDRTLTDESSRTESNNKTGKNSEQTTYGKVSTTIVTDTYDNYVESANYTDDIVHSGTDTNKTDYGKTHTEPGSHSASTITSYTGQDVTSTDSSHSRYTFNSASFEPTENVSTTETHSDYPEQTVQTVSNGDFETSEGGSDTETRTLNTSDERTVMGDIVKKNGSISHETVIVDGKKGDIDGSVSYNSNDKKIYNIDESVSASVNDNKKTVENGTDIKNNTGTETTKNTGTVSTEDTNSRTEDTLLVDKHTGTETTTHTGTISTEKEETENKDNTGTVTQRDEGTDDVLETIDITKKNTGTKENESKTATLTDNRETSSTTESGSTNTETNTSCNVKNTGTVVTIDDGTSELHREGTNTYIEADNGNTKTSEESTVTNNLANVSVGNNLIDKETDIDERVAIDIANAITNKTTNNAKDDLTITYGGSDTINGNETRNITGEAKDILNHKLTRKGNIGVTTTQQMLESEIDLWENFTFFDIVFNDLDSILCLAVY